MAYTIALWYRETSPDFCSPALQHVPFLGSMAQELETSHEKPWAWYQRDIRAGEQFTSNTEPPGPQRRCRFVSHPQADCRSMVNITQVKFWMFIMVFYFLKSLMYHLNRNLVRRTHFSMSRTSFSQSATCLLLVRTLLVQHYDGACCLWPNIHTYRVWLKYCIWLECFLKILFWICSGFNTS